MTRRCLRPPGADAAFGVAVAVAALVVSAVAAPAPTGAQELERLTADDVAAGDLFGCALSLDGPALLVGSLFDDDRGPDSGSAYVFARDQEDWRQVAKLVGDDTAAGDQLGFAVDLAGGRALLGAPLAAGAGAAYLFAPLGPAELGDWRQVARFAAPGSRGLGTSVALAGELVVAGAPRTAIGGALDAGAVYLFAARGGGPVATLVAEEPAAGEAYGWAVATDGETLAVGVPYRTGAAGSNAGAVEVYSSAGGAGWRRVAVLEAPEPGAFDAFGYAVAVAGETLAVGAPLADPAGRSQASAADAGAVYVYRRVEGVWRFEAKLFEERPGQQLGNAVALAGGGDSLLAGARRAGGGTGAATLFTFEGDGWRPGGRIRPAAARPGDEVGIAVDLSGLGLVLGAYRDDGGGLDAGAVWADVPPPEIDDGDGDGGDDDDDEEPEPEPDPRADLSVAVAPVEAAGGTGEPAGFTVTVANAGPDAAPGVGVSAPPSPGLADVTVTCVPAGGAVCPAAAAMGGGSLAAALVDARVDLPAGGSLVFTLTGSVVPCSGEVTQAATVTPPAGVDDPTPGDLAASAALAVEPRADLFLAITSLAGTVSPGEVIEHEVVFGNDGPCPVGPIGISSGLSPAFVSPTWSCTPTGGATCSPVEGSGPIESSIGLPPGGRTTFLLSATVAPGTTGEIVFSGSLGPLPGLDPDPSDNASSATTRVLERSDLAVTLDCGSPVAAGSTATCTATVVNGGPSPADGARVRLRWPTGFTPRVWSCAASPGSALCGAPTGVGAVDDTVRMAPGGSLVYTATARAVPGFLGTHDAVATVAATEEEDPVRANDRAVSKLVVVPLAGVGMTLSVDGTLVENGNGTYVLVIANGGPGELPDEPGPEVTLPLPLFLTALAATADVGTAEVAGDHLVTWSGSLAPGEVATVYVTVAVGPGTAGQTAVAIATYTGPLEPPPENDPDAEPEREQVRSAPPGGPPGPTIAVVRSLLDIPTLGELGLLALALLVAGFGLRRLH